MANDGTALGALKEVIGNAGGTSDAQTLVPAIEQLGEIIGSGGGGGGGTIPDGSITTKKLADGAVSTAKLLTRAVTNDKLADEAVKGRNIHPDSVTNSHIVVGGVQTHNIQDGAVTFDKLNNNAVRTIHSVSLVAADSQTDQALIALGFPHSQLTPAEMADGNEYANGTLRLCWISGTTLETAPISFYGNLQTQAVTLYARGHGSTATGVLGVDDSWTIAANA